MAKEELIEEIRKLTVDERLDIVDVIWDSLGEEVALDEATAAELERRMRDYEQSPEEGRPYRDVLVELRTRLVRPAE